MRNNTENSYIGNANVYSFYNAAAWVIILYIVSY